MLFYTFPKIWGADGNTGKEDEDVRGQSEDQGVDSGKSEGSQDATVVAQNVQVKKSNGVRMFNSERMFGGAPERSSNGGKHSGLKSKDKKRTTYKRIDSGLKKKY